jgi:hypothetical protein
MSFIVDNFLDFVPFQVANVGDISTARSSPGPEATIYVPLAMSLAFSIGSNMSLLV